MSGKIVRPLAKGYSEAGASVTRRALKGFNPNSGSPSEDINFNNKTMRQRCRMLYMSSPVATAAINTNRTKVVGVGLKLNCAVDQNVLKLTPQAAQEWQKKTQLEFALWASKNFNCDALGLNNFFRLQQLALKSTLMSGDCFALIKRREATPLNPYTLRIHLVEADRISTPDYCGMIGGLSPEGKIPEDKPGAGHLVHDGVEVDASGMVVAYHIRSTYPNQILSEPTKWERVLAYGGKTGLPNILQIMESERCEQYRGVPYLAQVIEPLLQVRRYTESELMAALVQSFFTAFIKTETDPSQLPFDEVGDGDGIAVPGDNPDSSDISKDENEYELGPGFVVHLKPGESVDLANPNIPTAGFETFIKAICRMIGAALEIPYDVLMKEFNSSYSASRGALLEAWEAIKMRRQWLVDAFCQPVYEIWLAEAVAIGRIKAPGFWEDPLLRAAWSRANWVGPVQGQLDPKKEVAAAISMVEHGFKTNAQVTQEMGGGSFDENIKQLTVENEMKSAAGCSRGKRRRASKTNDPAEPIEGGDGDA